jgi:hypothetical protein
MASLIELLSDTAATRWRDQVWGAAPESAAKPKAHGVTKETYFHAVVKCLAAGAVGTLPTWTDVVDMANGARATFYSVTGRKAIHPLIGEYDERIGRLPEVAAHYRRREAVATLIDEAKVWTYWSHRAGWLRQLQLNSEVTRPTAAQNLVRVLADWARSNPPLAVALDHSPPICAVEDLLLIQPDRPAADSVGLLRTVVATALGPPGTTADGVLTVVRADLESVAGKPSTDGRIRPEKLVAQLAESIDALIQELRALPPPDVAVFRQLTIDLLRDGLEEFGSLEEG